MPHKDPNKAAEYQTEYYKENKEKIKSRAATWNKENSKTRAERERKARADDPERFKRHTKKYRDGLKAKVLAHYGGMCNCCGQAEPEFLAVDHVNNDGYLDRKKYRTGGTSTYLLVIKEGFPDRFQLLCHNCNWSKHVGGGICIHKRGQTCSEN